MVRVPATRDNIELMYADMVSTKIKELEKEGKLPEPPSGFENILDFVDVSIDPHQSLHAMAPLLENFNELLNRLGFQVIRNNSNIPFITSDNPVIWFDPKYAEKEIVPHTIEPNGSAILIFPIAIDLLLVGTTANRADFEKYGLLEAITPPQSLIIMYNRLIAKFAYREVFSSRNDTGDLVSKFSNLSPTLKKVSIPGPKGITSQWTRIFGPIRKKAKWEKP